MKYKFITRLKCRKEYLMFTLQVYVSLTSDLANNKLKLTFQDLQMEL